MFRRAILEVRGLTALGCVALAMAPTMARGDGSILFNGNSSFIQNDVANILNSSTNITVCVWVKATGRGEGGEGTILRLDEVGTKVILGHENDDDKLNWYGGLGRWIFDAPDEVWCAVAITKDMTNSNAPVVRVNFVTVTASPSGTVGPQTPVPDTGYCIGNNASNYIRGWDWPDRASPQSHSYDCRNGCRLAYSGFRSERLAIVAADDESN